MFRSTYSSNTSQTHESFRVEAGVTTPKPARQRWLLLISTVLLLTAPLALFEPASHWADDPELFRLLRGMAGLKGLIMAIAFSVVWWRLGRSLSKRMAATYVGSVCAMALATGLIWELTTVHAASGLFHLATLMLLIVAWRDVQPQVSQQAFNQ